LRPGELTRRYVEGERARFVSPMALFLFSVFLMFAVFQVMGIGAPTEFDTPPGTTVEADAEQQLSGLRTAREAMGDDNPGTPIVDAQIAAAERRLAAAGASEGAGQPGETVVLAQGKDSTGRLSARRTGYAFIDDGIEKWRKNPGLMAYKMQANSYKFSWLLIPLSIPFVWLIFAWRRKFGAYDHAV